MICTANDDVIQILSRADLIALNYRDGWIRMYLLPDFVDFIDRPSLDVSVRQWTYIRYAEAFSYFSAKVLKNILRPRLAAVSFLRL